MCWLYLNGRIWEETMNGHYDPPRIIVAYGLLGAVMIAKSFRSFHLKTQRVSSETSERGDLPAFEGIWFNFLENSCSFLAIRSSL